MPLETDNEAARLIESRIRTRRRLRATIRPPMSGHETDAMKARIKPGVTPCI